MPTALSFKGDAKPKKRKRTHPEPSMTSPALLNGSTHDTTDPIPHDTDDQSWLPASNESELAGPVMLVFARPWSPSQPHHTTSTTTTTTSSPAAPAPAAVDEDGDGTYHALSADALGRVSTQSVTDTMLPGRPDSAEPADVRQVWVVGRVSGVLGLGLKSSGGRWLGWEAPAPAAGTVAATKALTAAAEGEDQVGIKGTGRGTLGLAGMLAQARRERGEEYDEDGARYESRTQEQAQERGLVVDEPGTLAALKEARGPGENWILEELGADSRIHGATAFYMRTCSGRYLSLSTSDSHPQSHSKSNGSASGGPKLTTLPSPDPLGYSVLLVKMQAGHKPRLTAARAERAYEKITRAEIEREAGRALDDETVKRLKRARRRGTYREEMLDVRTKGRGDKFA